MFIYADESGHTGRYIFNNPPFYFQGAILAASDPEPIISPIADSFRKKLTVDRLHANELPQKVAEEIAIAFLESLRAINWVFHLTVIEKPYLSITKFIDTIFDSGENKGARWSWYYHEFFRHSLCCFFDDLLPLEKKQQFWNAYLQDDDQGVCSVVKYALECLDEIDKIDARLKQVSKDSLTFALEHPEDITLMGSQKKNSYKGHSPNMVAFISLLQSVHGFCKDNDVVPESFIHDPQCEFGSTMQKYHDLHSNVRINEHKLGLPQPPESVDYGLGKFELKSSKDVASLQAVDLFLWLSQRTGGVQNEELREALSERTNPFYISRDMSEMIRAKWALQLSQRQFTREEIAKGKEVVEEMERIHIEQISEFKKNLPSDE